MAETFGYFSLFRFKHTLWQHGEPADELPLFLPPSQNQAYEGRRAELQSFRLRFGSRSWADKWSDTKVAKNVGDTYANAGHGI